MKIRYNRVSTTHQNLDRQQQHNDQYDKVFEDKASAKNTDRPAFRQMMAFVREGDTVVFESFSRISRSLTDLLSILDELERKGVKWVSEKEQVSTEGATGKLVVSVLAAISAYEREINKERREYGFNKAMKEGRVGRPATEYTDTFKAAYNAWKAQEITAVEAMKRTGVSKATWYKMAQHYEKEQA